MIKKFTASVMALATALSCSFFTAYAEDTAVYDVSKLTTEMHLNKGDTLHCDSDVFPKLDVIMLSDGEISHERAVDYVVPCDSVVLSSSYLYYVFLVAEDEKDNYADIRDFEVGDTVDTDSYILCYDYEVNGYSKTGILSPDEYAWRIGEGDIEVAAVNHEQKSVTFRALSEQGDLNNDGFFSISDLVILQRWLIGEGELDEWQNVDYDKDGIVDIFDFCIMKSELLKKISSPHEISDDELIILLVNSHPRELTWSDLENFTYTETDNGVYEYPFEEHEYIKLIVSGSRDSESPETVEFVSDDNYEQAEDFYQVRYELLLWIYEPENDAATQDRARKIGEYALSQLKQGVYSVDTEIYDYQVHDMMSDDIADLWYFDDDIHINGEKMFTALYFIDEHTVALVLDKGWWTSYSYLITDGTTEYQVDEFVDDFYIDWKDGNLYYCQY